MNSKSISERLQMLTQLHLLVVIVERSKSKKIIEILRTKKMPGQFVFHALGTANSDIMDMIGLGSNEKAVVTGFVTNKLLPDLISDLSVQTGFHKAGRGIAFSIPLSGMLPPPIIEQQACIEWIHKFESEVENVNEYISHDLIMVIVNEGCCDDVMEAARTAGATGGTIMHALHFGSEDMSNFFGVPMKEKKDVITILVKREQKQDILDALNKKLDPKTHRTVFCLPADHVTGLNQTGL